MDILPKRLFSRRNRKRIMTKLTKMMAITILIIGILGSSLKPCAADSVIGGEKIIGIDLGTTQTVLSFSADGMTTIIPNDQGNRITPSIVGFTDTEILVGDAAYNQMHKNALNTVFDAKRFIGRSYHDPTVQKDIKLLPFEVINKNNKPHFKVSYQGKVREFSAEEISAMVLKKLKQTAEAYLGEAVNKAVITVPAYFDDMQKQATKDAGTIAGLEVVRIINEPTSAALAYGINQKHAESSIIIYDLGGGTFDVSLLSLDDGIFEVEASGGDTHLGGEDFDENVVKYMIKQFKKKHNLDISQDTRALSKLRRECEKAKRALSSTKQIKIEIENIMNGVDFSEMLTRARFEDLNMKLFRKTLKALDNVLSDSGKKKNEIDEIVLVGGSTRIPKIQEMVKQYFNGKELNRGINPDEAVATGASIQASILAGTYGEKGDSVLLIDSAGLSLGIETVGGIMTKIIERNTKYPVSKSKVFSTHQDNQDSVLIQIYQGERAETKNNRFLGKFMLSGIPPQPRGVPQIEVTFEIDANGILQVEASEKSMGESQKLVIKRDEHMNLRQEEIERIVAEFERFAADDENVVKRTEAKNRLESAVFGLKAKLVDKREEMEESEYMELMEVCEEMGEWMDDNGGDAEYDDFVEKQQEFDEVVGTFYGRYQDSAHDQDYDRDDHFDHEGL